MKLQEMQLGLSPITEKVYLGKVSKKNPNEWIGDKKDITSNFIAVVLQKFEPNTISNITVNGKTKYTLTVKEV